MANYAKLPALLRQLKKSGYPDIPITPSDEQALLDGCYFDSAKGWHVVDYIEYYCKLTKGKWRGKPIELLPWQAEGLLVPVFGWMMPDGLRRIRKSTTFIPKKNGKALSLDTLIPTPNGYKEMGDLFVGDQVFDELGNPCNVVAVSEVFKDRECYKITSATGGIVICDGNHEWVLKKSGSSGKDVIIEAKKLYDEYQNGKRYSFSVAESLKIPKSELPIPAYTLGIWLGDGCSGSARITVGYEDLEILDYIKAEGVPIKEGKSSNSNSGIFSLSDGIKNRYREDRVIQVELKKLNLIDNKHIPEMYFWASEEDRLSLLQGLMDSDGTCSKSGQCEFSVISERLANDVFRLIRTLGVKPSITKGKARLNGKEISDRYRIQFYPDKSISVFKLKRKKSKQVGIIRENSKKRNWCNTGWVYPKTRSKNEYIKSIERVPNQDTKCIEVDSPSHQFLCTKYLIPTHNSTLCSALVPYLLDPKGDNEPGAEVYLCATAREQATIVFRESANMVESSPDLRKKFKVFRGGNNKSITLDTSTWARALSADANTNEGLNAHGLILDEIHAWKDREFFASIIWASSARDQPLIFEISTAGSDLNSLGGDEYTYAKKVRDGEIKDVTMWPLIFEARPEDDLEDEEVWKKANPSLGYSIPLSRFREDFESAKQKGGKDWSDFKRYRFNIWGGADAPYLSISDWAKYGEEFSEDDLTGRPCYLGVDLSSKEDITSICYCFPFEDHYKFLWRFWAPEDTIKEKIKKGESNYLRWSQSKHLFSIPGARIDQGIIEEQILIDAKRFDIKEAIFDPWNAGNLVQRIDSLSSFTVIEMTTSYKNFSHPVKELKAHLADGKIRHGGNPVAYWMAENMIVKENQFEDIMPVKKAGKMKYKIDGMVALLMGFSRAIALPIEEAKSRYEEEGAEILVL